ncbi:MAG TPA: hypothetical protein DD808_01500, partial [Halieaceae bacterium]|nr:hypothetical protein [Halieaceae bacterium]
ATASIATTSIATAGIATTSVTTKRLRYDGQAISSLAEGNGLKCVGRAVKSYCYRIRQRRSKCTQH